MDGDSLLYGIMHRFFIESANIEGNAAKLSQSEAQHAIKVLRLNDGDKVEALDGKGGAWQGTLKLMGESASIILGEKILSNDSPIRLTVYMGLPKGEKSDLIAQKLTELGASKLVLVRMERCIAKIAPNEAEKKLARTIRISAEAQKQSGRQSQMEIPAPADFGEMLKMLKSHERCFLLWENAQNLRLIDIKREHENLRDIGVIVGPEGGISEAEAQKIADAGADVITLGKRILRCETAAIAACAAIQALWGDL